MPALTVIAKLKAKIGREEDLLTALQGLVTYDLHRSHDDPGVFIFYETWESRPVWEDHMKTPHLVAFGDRQGELTETWELFTGEKV